MKRLSFDLAEALSRSKNLLAFSHGVDSTALFYLLEEAGVPFDLALVNYGVRPEAEEEERAARELASLHGKRIHVVRAPKWQSDFEAEARRFRYAFFEELIEGQGYECLLTAHQLEDRMEWLLMRLGRGAGAAELAGMARWERRRTSGGREYRLFRPLLEVSRRELLRYLEENGRHYFVDGSNESGENERSRIRPFVSAFVGEHKEGIVRSFRYLERDRKALEEEWEILGSRQRLRLLRLHSPGAAPRAAAEALKELGYLLTGAERERIRRGESLVAGRRWAVERTGELLYIAPYLPEISMPKSYRERCRKAGIPPKIRPYAYRMDLDPEKISIREG
jgi:tRNA(Ile)-lysidine synthase